MALHVRKHLKRGRVKDDGSLCLEKLPSQRCLQHLNVNLRLLVAGENSKHALKAASMCSALARVKDDGNLCLGNLASGSRGF